MGVVDGDDSGGARWLEVAFVVGSFGAFTRTIAAFVAIQTVYELDRASNRIRVASAGVIATTAC